MEREVIHKEIDLIQACIARMAHNSFLLKGWTISIIAVILALADKTSSPGLLALILLIPILGFWYLDAFFLRTERMYRKMYEWVLEKRKANDESFLYDLNARRFEQQVESMRQVIWSKTLRVFYGIPFIITLAVVALRIVQEILKRGVRPLA